MDRLTRLYLHGSYMAEWALIGTDDAGLLKNFYSTFDVLIWPTLLFKLSDRSYSVFLPFPCSCLVEFVTLPCLQWEVGVSGRQLVSHFPKVTAEIRQCLYGKYHICSCTSSLSIPTRTTTAAIGDRQVETCKMTSVIFSSSKEKWISKRLVWVLRAQFKI
jgi:hypothetical protein